MSRARAVADMCLRDQAKFEVDPPRAEKIAYYHR